MKLEELGQALVNIRATIQDGKDKIIEYIRKMASGDKAETRWRTAGTMMGRQAPA